MGVGQRHLRAWPVGGHLAAQSFEHRAAGSRLTQLLPAAFDQQVAQPLEHGLMRLTHAGQHEQPIERLALMLEIRDWRDESEARTLHRLLAAEPPQAIPQRQRLAERQTGIEARLHALRPLEQLDALPGQLIEVIGDDAQPDQLAIERQCLRRTLQQINDRLGALRLLQRLAQIAFAQRSGQQLQQPQMLIRPRGNADGEVHLLTVSPIHTGGKVQQPHTGGEHLIAGLRRAVGNRDALTEKGRALRFARAQTVEVTGRHQPVGDQHLAQQSQRRGLICCGLMHVDVLCIQLKHGRTPAGLAIVVADGCAGIARILGWRFRPKDC